MNRPVTKHRCSRKTAQQRTDTHSHTPPLQSCSALSRYISAGKSSGAVGRVVSELSLHSVQNSQRERSMRRGFQDTKTGKRCSEIGEKNQWANQTNRWLYTYYCTAATPSAAKQHSRARLGLIWLSVTRPALHLFISHSLACLVVLIRRWGAGEFIMVAVRLHTKSVICTRHWWFLFTSYICSPVVCRLVLEFVTRGTHRSEMNTLPSSKSIVMRSGFILLLLYSVWLCFLVYWLRFLD